MTEKGEKILRQLRNEGWANKTLSVIAWIIGFILFLGLLLLRDGADGVF
jgi:hypothetical protein